MPEQETHVNPETGLTITVVYPVDKATSCANIQRELLRLAAARIAAEEARDEVA